MRTLPTTDYSGLTIILDEPSRFDKQFDRLLSGPAREYLNKFLPDSFHVDSCDIRVIDDSSPLLPATQAILLGGEKSCRYYRLDNDPPGYAGVIRIDSQLIPALPIFYPQDCCDYQNMRGDDNDDNPEAVSDRDAKEVIPTRPMNRRFWNSWHIVKFLSGCPAFAPAELHIYPNEKTIIDVLNSTKNEDLYLDIETSRYHRSISCIGFSTASTWPNIYVVPIYLHKGTIAYNNIHRIIRALSLAISRSTVVAHNGSFDLSILHGFYKLCLPNNYYDTMLAQHRIFPEAEKSLAHVISCWTAFPNHKNFDTDVYDDKGERNLWTYNGYDVYTLKPIKDCQLTFAEKVHGLCASISQINSSVIPYLCTSLQGLPLDLPALSITHGKLSVEKTLYQRMASILIGKNFNPGSTDQCAAFFCDKLNYPIESRTKTGKPAMGSKQLYQMLLKHKNPLINVIIKYREVAKDASSLESELFKLP